MHILLVADGRSPITRNWVNSLLTMKHSVTLVSTFPCAHMDGTLATHIFPLAFSSLGGSQVSNKDTQSKKKSPSLRKAIANYRRIFQSARSLIGPATLPFYAKRFQNLVNEYSPDLVHALRIPYEGMLASYTPPQYPLAVSIWGNDLTLHAPGSQSMTLLTRQVLHRVNGLIADVFRDLRLSRQWGFNPEFPSMVALTSGGIDIEEIAKAQNQRTDLFKHYLPDEKVIIINPRGLRPGYVRNDTFFQSIPILIERFPEAHFACPSMEGQPEALRWIKRLRISNHVSLLPYLTQNQLWELFYRSQISISVTIHDGTPNTLLEAMVCGSFPIVGDIESLREWITPGINGMLVEPDQPQSLAEATLLALESPSLRQRAAEINLELVRERSEAGSTRIRLENFYQRVVEDKA